MPMSPEFTDGYQLADHVLATGDAHEHQDLTRFAHTGFNVHTPVPRALGVAARLDYELFLISEGETPTDQRNLDPGNINWN
jgi:hypothetical protein